jgi:hypothetical protein
MARHYRRIHAWIPATQCNVSARQPPLLVLLRN